MKIYKTLKIGKFQEKVKTAKVEIGRVYHVYDPETGGKQDADKVENRFEE